MGAKYRDRVMVSFWLGRRERDLVLAMAKSRKCSQAAVWRMLIESALESPLTIFATERTEHDRSS